MNNFKEEIESLETTIQERKIKKAGLEKELEMRTNELAEITKEFKAMDIDMDTIDSTLDTLSKQLSSGISECKTGLGI